MRRLVKPFLIIIVLVLIGYGVFLFISHRKKVNTTIEVYSNLEGMLVDIVSSSIEEVCGAKPTISTTGGTSDGRFIARLCDQVVEFGPINESIHKINEHIDIGCIDKLKDIEKLALKKALA